MTYEYRIGGSLAYNHPTYVKRKADKALLEALQTGEFCYVFNCRQMGKSSLRVCTIHQLQKEGFVCASIDITSLGSESNIQKWYNGFITQLFLGFNLNKKINLKAWLKEREDISPVQKLKDFLENVILTEFESQKIIICIDEIDKIISLEFSSDDFFSFIRFCYNQRAENKNYERLTFALFGVTTPSDLIREKTQTSFNIGQAIELTGFTSSEAKTLEEGLKEKVADSRLALKDILYWTGGQPFLTQKLCQYVYKYTDFITLENQSEIIKKIVNTSLIENWESQDEPIHFKTIKDRLLRNEQKAGRLLGIYQQILKQGWIEVDNSPEQTELKLSGLVVSQNSKLVVYNPIYQAIFNQDWLIKQLEKLRPYSEAIDAWERSNYQDESRLLQGLALKDALVWTVGKSLSNLDYQFLNASQKLDQKEIEINLETERKANQILKDANQKAKYMIRIGSVILSLSLVSAIGSAIATFQANDKQQEAQLGTQLQQIGETAWRQFQFQQIEALMSSMQAGQQLKTIVKDQRILAQYPTTSPIISLQQILKQIQEKNQLESHQEAVTSIAFSPNNNYLATASRDNTVKLWTRQGKEIRTLKGHQGAIYGVAFSPDSETIATASQDRTIKLWNLQGKELETLQGHRGSVYSVSFSPDGQFLASTSRDETARLWNLKEQKSIVFRGHKKSVDDVSFSPDSKHIATVSRDESLIIWNLKGEKSLIIKQESIPFYSVSFSPDGKYIAAATSDGITKVWNLQGMLILTLKDSQENVNSVNFSPDGKSLATASSDGTAKIWTLEGQEITTLKGHQEPVYEAVFSPDSQYLATASSDGTAKLWKINSTFSTQDNLAEIGITSIGFSPDGKKIAKANKEGYINVENIPTQQEYKFSSDLEWIYDISFSPNSQKIAAASRSGIAKIWDTKGNVLAEIKADSTPVYSLSFNPNKAELAIGLGDGNLQLWDITNKSPQLKKTVQVDVNPISSIAFSPDGTHLAIASREGIIKLLNQEKQFNINFSSNQNRIYKILFSPDGQKIATASTDGTVKLWNLQGQLLATLRGDLFPVYSLVFSSDGKQLATASSDGTARIWDTTGQLRSEYKGEQNSLLGINFTLNNQEIITVTQNGKIQEWQVENELSRLNNLLNQGCQWLEDYLNTHPQEREKLDVCQN